MDQTGALDVLFELPTIVKVPGDHRDIELFAADGRCREAAAAIGRLRAAALIDGERAALAEATCWLHAGQPERAVAILAPHARTVDSLWCLACSLVRLRRLDDAASRVLAIGQRVPLLGPRRRAAKALLLEQGMPLPAWLADPGRRSGRPGASRMPAPPPHLASFFVPSQPEVPPGFEELARTIQRGAYYRAAQLLADRAAATPTVGIQLAMAVAECWLLAGEPALAQAWLRYRLPLRGVWALACAHVQQNHLEEALGPLSTLARRRGLRDEWEDAAAALLAYLGLSEPPPDLMALADHPLLTGGQAEVEGYHRFARNVAREIARLTDAGAIERTVKRVETRCAELPSEQAQHVLLAAYEAAVRVSPAPRLVAQRGLGLLFSRPQLLGAEQARYSMALLFAMACERLDDLRRLLRELAAGSSEERRYACSLALAKLCLVQDDIQGLLDNAVAASGLVELGPDYMRAARLRRAARWLTPDELPRISEWRLRRLHHLLPLAVAQRLDDRDRELIAWMRSLAASSPVAEALVEQADRHLQVAVRLGESATGALPRLRQALGSWALLIGRAQLETAGQPDEAVAFTGAAWLLLGPDAPSAVAEAHARAIGLACAGLERANEVHAAVDVAMTAIPCPAGSWQRFSQDVIGAWMVWRRTLRDGLAIPPVSPKLTRLLRRAAAPPTEPCLHTVDEILGGLDNLTAEVRETIERCVVDRLELLPSAPPFRGRRWFQSDAAWALYQRGREESDGHEARRAFAAHKAFEEAWRREPNVHITTHGLITGLGRRLREKSARTHLLNRLAHALEQGAEREVEAALAHDTLARLASGMHERRDHLERAAAALARRVRRQPWTRARNAEIAIELELGNLLAAGDAAWVESNQHLPGFSASRRYALLAAALWMRAPDSDQLREARIEEAERRARMPKLSNGGAVQYAVEAGSLVLLTDLALDKEALEDLWNACRGNEDELMRFLEKQGTRPVDPRPGYLQFLAQKLAATDPVAAARIRNRFLLPDAAPQPPRLLWLRLAAAELLARDPLHEVPTPRNRLRQPHVRDFLACMRRSSGRDEVAYTAFDAAVEDALGALFDLGEEVRVTGPERYGERLAGASAAVSAVSWSARRFATPELARIAGLIARYLELALDPPTVDGYLLEKEKRLVPSTLGAKLGEWWARLSRESAGALDFFHLHELYRLVDGTTPGDWWGRRVQGQPMRDALRQLTESLETNSAELARIEERLARARRAPRGTGFGLLSEFEICCRILRAALEDGAGVEALGAVESALERLGASLRAIDLSRLMDAEPQVLYDSALPDGRYLLPRAVELLAHWRRNVRPDPCLQAAFEIRDDSGSEVLCLMTLDRGSRPVPESTPLRGLAQFADLVDALGGQFHLWVARPGDRRGCRREHLAGPVCTADDYAARIEARLRELAATSWYDRRAEVQQWLNVLDGALHSVDSAALAFALLPRLHG